MPRKVTQPQNTNLSLKERTLPRWSDLPDFGLYMDQVLSLMERYLGPSVEVDEKGITASMVNNYVKMGVVPAPEKKKYSRIHLASLIVVCALKPVLPLATIQGITANMRDEEPERFYDVFCEQFEAAEQLATASTAHLDPEAAPDSTDVRDALVSSALNAQSYRHVALALCRK